MQLESTKRSALGVKLHAVLLRGDHYLVSVGVSVSRVETALLSPSPSPITWSPRTGVAAEITITVARVHILERVRVICQEYSA